MNASPLHRPARGFEPSLRPSVRQNGSSRDALATRLPELHLLTTQFAESRALCPVARASNPLPGCPRSKPFHDSHQPGCPRDDLARHVLAIGTHRVNHLDAPILWLPWDELVSTSSPHGFPRDDLCLRRRLFCDSATQKSFRLRRIHLGVAPETNRVFDRASLHSHLWNVPYPRRIHRTVARTMKLAEPHPPHSFPHDRTRLRAPTAQLPVQRAHFAVLASRLPARRARLDVLTSQLPAR